MNKSDFKRFKLITAQTSLPRPVPEQPFLNITIFGAEERDVDEEHHLQVRFIVGTI